MRYQTEMHDRRSFEPLVALLLGILAFPAFSVSPALAAPAGTQLVPLVVAKEHGDHGARGDRGDRVDRGRADEDASDQRGGVIRGTVASVDYGRNVLYIDAGGARQRIQLTPTTTLEMRGSRAVSIADFRPGQHVDVYLTIIGGMPIAQIVRLR